MKVNPWFLAVFALVWAAGSGTQLLFLVAPKLHHRLGMTEQRALDDEFRWFLLDKKMLSPLRT